MYGLSAALSRLGICVWLSNLLDGRDRGVSEGRPLFGSPDGSSNDGNNLVLALGIESREVVEKKLDDIFCFFF